MACQSVSRHRGQEGQDAGVDGGSGQLDVERGWCHSEIQVATVVRTQTVATHLWDQVRQHRATLHCHHLLQAVQSKLCRLRVVLTNTYSISSPPNTTRPPPPPHVVAAAAAAALPAV